MDKEKLTSILRSLDLGLALTREINELADFLLDLESRIDKIEKVLKIKL